MTITQAMYDGALQETLLRDRKIEALTVELERHREFQREIEIVAFGDPESGADADSLLAWMRSLFEDTAVQGRGHD